MDMDIRRKNARMIFTAARFPAAKYILNHRSRRRVCLSPFFYNLPAPVRDVVFTIVYAACRKLSKGIFVMTENNIKLSPSALSCNFFNPSKAFTALEEAGIDWLHLDVMDGVFVPNISFGQVVIKSLRKSCNSVFDVHLMITEPIRYIKDFADAGADYITVHAEACSDVEAALRAIRATGKKAGLSVKPKTPVESVMKYLPLCDLFLVMTVEPGFGGQSFMADMMPKVEAVASERRRLGLDFRIEVDGGIDAKTAPICAKAGADTFVAGSSVLAKPDPVLAAKEIINVICCANQ